MPCLPPCLRQRKNSMGLFVIFTTKRSFPAEIHRRTVIFKLMYCHWSDNHMRLTWIWIVEHPLPATSKSHCPFLDVILGQSVFTLHVYHSSMDFCWELPSAAEKQITKCHSSLGANMLVGEAHHISSFVISFCVTLISATSN